MKRYILPAVIASISFIACNNSNDESGYLPGTTATPSTQQSSSSNTSLQPNVSIQPQPGTQAVPQPTTQTVQAPTVTTTTATAAPAQVAKGMNPPHGQPGHRCDIEVGAPLNSKPKTTTTAANTTAQIQPQVIQPTPATTTTAPGMNPAHGQPGHRCDIAVGAPLDSKPAQTTNEVKPIQLTTPKKDSTSNR